MTVTPLTFVLLFCCWLFLNPIVHNWSALFNPCSCCFALCSYFHRSTAVFSHIHRTAVSNMWKTSTMIPLNMATITISQLNHFPGLIAESLPESTSVSHWEGWYRPGMYEVLDADRSRIGTFQWRPQSLTSLQLKFKFSYSRPELWGIYLEHDEAAVRASTFWQRKLVLERRSESQFHPVRSLEIRYTSHVPLPDEFPMENSIVFQAKEGMMFYFYTDGSKAGFFASVKGAESLRDEDFTMMPGDVYDGQRLIIDKSSDVK
jgi:hypothetical protein